jgi:glycosyltransferase involved in cell wall biosynthesis
VPRILVTGFCAFPGPDRAGVQLRHVVRALLRSHQVDVLTVRRGDQAYVERWSGARLLRVPIAEAAAVGVRVEAFRRALRRQLEGADYHAIHVRDGFAGQVALEQAARLKLAVVYDATRAPLSQPGALDEEATALSEPVETELLERADLVLVGTEAARRYLAGSRRAGRVVLVPPGVDVDAFDWEDDPSTDPPRVLYVGALEPGRGVRVLITAMHQLPRDLRVELVLAGPAAPGFLDGLRTALAELGMADRVVLQGEVPHAQLPALIASARVCVATRAAEVGELPTALFPTKLLEYMACKRAVVAPRQSAVAALVRDEQQGLLYEPGAPGDLAAKIARLLTDAELRDRLARGGYDLVRRGHTAASTRRELRRAYAQLAAMPAFRSRFAERIEDPASESPAVVTGELSDGALVERRRASSAGQAFGGDDDGIARDDDEGAVVDTGVHEVTKVEPPPPGYPPASTGLDTPSLGDDWVVDDSRIREPPGITLDRERTGTEPRFDPNASRFVSGEVHVVPPALRQPVELDQPFVAMAAPLGFAPPVRPGGTDETP